MGKVAKIGIVGGRKVNSDAVLEALKPEKLPSFAVVCLRQHGLLPIVDKIHNRTPLDEEDLLLLLQCQSLPSLMKLVQLKQGKSSDLKLVPVKLISLEECLEIEKIGESIEMQLESLSSFGDREIGVSLDLPAQWNFEYLEKVASFLEKLPNNFRLIAPTAESVLQWVVRKEGCKSAWSKRRLILWELMQAIRSTGFNDMRHFSLGGTLKLAGQAGLTNVFETRLDCYPTTESLVSHLKQLKSYVIRNPVVKVWSVGFAASREWNTAYDLALLRLCAVGALYLDQIPFKTCINHSLSLNGYEVLPLFGGSGEIYGGVDKASCIDLEIHSVESMERVLEGMEEQHGE